MGYHIYTTDGIILKRTPFGEANILLHILTSDLGLIVAGARSARLSSSKLRSALQEYSLVSVSCVKGKNGWKITNVVENGNYFFDYPIYSRKVSSQISSVLVKMIPGESPHKKIFEITKTGLEFLKSLTKEDVQGFEMLIILRILYELGYVEKKQDVDILLKEANEWSTDILGHVSENQKTIVSLINKAFTESHL